MTAQNDTENTKGSNAVSVEPTALLGCPMSSKEIYYKIYGNPEAWEREWLAGNTEWWPDTIDLPGDAEQIIRSGCPSSPMPRKAQERIQKLRDAGETYVTHVSPGVHAYRIGFASEYLTNAKSDSQSPENYTQE
jgi:hypothetical protein